MRKTWRRAWFVILVAGWAFAGLSVGSLTPKSQARELITEPLTIQEGVTRSQKAATPEPTPTPEYFGHALQTRRYGEKKSKRAADKVVPPDGEIVTEPILDSTSPRHPRRPLTPSASPQAEPVKKKVFSYTPKSADFSREQPSRDTEGPVPLKGEDLETEPLYNNAVLPSLKNGDRRLQIKAELDRNRVHLDESFTLTVDIIGPDLTGIELAPPRMENLDLINTNQAETRITQNGRMLKQRTYHFVYLPLTTGTITVPAVRIVNRGLKSATEPLTLEVEGARSGFAFQRKFSGQRSLMPKMVASAPDDSSVKAENTAEFYALLTHPWVYVNQQVNLTVRYRCQTEVGTKVEYRPPSLVGFISEELPQTQAEALVSGTRFRTLERAYRTALFPIHAGQLNIGSAMTVLSQGAKNKTQFSDPLTLEVKALPADPEAGGENGGGLVGKYTLETRVEAPQAVAEAPIRIQFILKGEGNLRGAPEPQLPRDTAWQWQLEEQRLSTRIENDVIQGEIIFKYLAVPGKPGKASPGEARLRYFNPQEGRWRTASARLPAIRVSPRQPQIAVEAPRTETAAATQPPQKVLLRPNRGGNRILLTKRKLLVEETAFWAVQGAFLVLCLGGWLWTHRGRRTEEDAQAARARRAMTEIRSALKSAQRLIVNHQVQPFYDSISRATAEYLAAKFGVPATAIVIERLPELFERFSVPENFQSQFKLSLTVCEYVRFAAMEFPVQDMLALHADLARTVADFEKFWKQQQIRSKKNALTSGAVLLVLLAICAPNAQAGETELYFLRGNTYAQEGKFEAALAEYQKVVSLGVDDPDVYYNLGNMYLRLGQIARAELAYERGLQL
ncbi:MAG: tetratricopeptide repeat protein, partial [Candidatus Firestonebacteria bacterium]|nr:tetratricopeptide repeat protein [Candidatus Firestonebacteria bacterium]